MSDTQRPGCRDAAGCQDVMKAFLDKQGIGGLFYHCLLANHLKRAGFEVRQVEREDNHADVWVLRLRRGRVPVGHEIEWTKKQVCLFLRRLGLRYPSKEVVVMVQGERIKAAFNWEKGGPGWVIQDRGKRGGEHRRESPATRPER